MTDAAYNKANHSGAMPGNRVSTHPSYTEYTWDTLTRPAEAAAPSAKAPARPVNTARPVNPAKQEPVRRNVRQAAAQPAAQNYADQRYARNQGYVPRPIPGQRTAPGNSISAQGNLSAQAKKARDAAAKASAEALRRAEASRAKTAAALKKQAAKAEKIRRKSMVAIHTIAAEQKYAFPLSIVLISLCFTVLILAIVTTSVQIGEITSVNASLRRQYNSLVSEENELRLQLETRDDLRIVENMARGELGMVKKDEVQRYYLTVRKEDRIEIIEEVVKERENLIDGILGFGASIVERVRNFFGV